MSKNLDISKKGVFYTNILHDIKIKKGADISTHTNEHTIRKQLDNVLIFNLSLLNEYEMSFSLLPNLINKSTFAYVFTACDNI